MAIILLIEDHPILRPAMRDLLQLAGHTVLTMTNNQDARAFLAEHSAVDLVLIDAELTRSDSITNIKRIRSLKQYAKRPILMFAVNALPGMEQTAYEAGVDVYLPPPLSARALQQAVANALSTTVQQRDAQPAR